MKFSIGFMFLIAVLVSYLPVNADILRVRGTAPLQNNSYSCSVPKLTTANSKDSLWVIIQIAGPMARRDSVWRRPGGAFELTYNVPRGTYIITAIPGRPTPNGIMNYGCPASITATATTATPWKPVFTP